MRAKREYNELTAKSFRNQSKKTRIKKNIEKTQKYYTDAKARIASQAKLMQSQATCIFQNIAGINSNINAFTNPYGMGSSNGFAIQSAFNSIGAWNSADANKNNQISEAQFKAIMALQNAGISLNDSNTENINKFLEKNNITGNDIDAAKLIGCSSAYHSLIQSGQQDYFNRSQWLNNAQTSFGQNVTIWEQYMNAQLEAEQDLALEPLNYEETMMELEETTIKTQLEEKKEEMQTLKQELAERVKEDVPKFGLA